MQKIMAGNAPPSLTRLFPINSSKTKSISLGLESTKVQSDILRSISMELPPTNSQIKIKLHI